MAKNEVLSSHLHAIALWTTEEYANHPVFTDGDFIMETAILKISSE